MLVLYVDYSYDYEYCIDNNISGKIKVYTNDFVLPDCLTKLLTEMKKKGII